MTYRLCFLPYMCFVGMHDNSFVMWKDVSLKDSIYSAHFVVASSLIRSFIHIMRALSARLQAHVPPVRLISLTQQRSGQTRSCLSGQQIPALAAQGPVPQYQGCHSSYG